MTNVYGPEEGKDRVVGLEEEEGGRGTDRIGWWGTRTVRFERSTASKHCVTLYLIKHTQTLDF